MPGSVSRSTLGVAALVFGAIALIAINLWSSQGLGRYRADMTEGGIYTLSDATRSVLSNLDEPVTLRFFYTSDLGEQVPTYARYHDRVLSMLRHYESLAAGKLRVALVKADRFTDEEDEAAAVGLQGAPLPGGNGSAYFGLAGTNSTDEVETIPFLALERQEFLELDLTRIIFKLANAGKKKIAMMSRLPVVGNINPQTGQQIPAWEVFNQLREFFDVDVLAPTFDALADDVDLLLMIAPAVIDEKTAYAIDQFALSGKPVIVFADPYSEVLPGRREGFKDNPEYVKLLKAWGISIDGDKVVGDIENSRQVQYINQGSPTIVNYVTWLAMPETSFDRSDGVFNQVSSLLMASTGALEPAEGSRLSFQPLVASSLRSSMVEAKQLANPNPIKLLQTYLPDNKQRILAARTRGDASSAFASGKPATAKVESEHRATGAVNVLTVADADMLFDSFWAEIGEQQGQRSVIPRAGNANFLINAISDMAGGQALAGLRGRGVEQRPFTRVDALRTDANARFRQQEQLLNKRLEETQKKLTSLLTRSKDGKVTLTEADQKAIEDFRTEMFTVRKSLREVQLNLRADIDALGTRVKAINIAIVPLLIGLFGFVALWRRRSRVSLNKAKGVQQ